MDTAGPDCQDMVKRSSSWQKGCVQPLTIQSVLGHWHRFLPVVKDYGPFSHDFPAIQDDFFGGGGAFDRPSRPNENKPSSKPVGRTWPHITARPPTILGLYVQGRAVGGDSWAIKGVGSARSLPSPQML